MARGLVIFSAKQMDYLQRLYLTNRYPTGQCVMELNKKFHTSFTRKQIYEVIRTRKWRPLRDAMEEKIEEVLAKPASAYASAGLGEAKRNHKAAMERFVSQAEIGADKAAVFIQRSRSARDLASAVGAHRAAIQTYRLCAGLDQVTQSSGNSFVFNFAAMAPKPAQTREIPVQEASAANAHGNTGSIEVVTTDATGG